MRVLAVSDIHIDYDENRQWLFNLSEYDYKDDILIIAGDITDIPALLFKAFEIVKSRFSEVIFLPGNHDLWVLRNNINNSLEQFFNIKAIAHDSGIHMEPLTIDTLTIIPLLGWYDYSFGKFNKGIYNIWADYTACKWPDNFDEMRITEYFTALNEKFLNIKNKNIISFSHFLPRIDLMPFFIPPDKRILYSVLGTSILEKQIRKLGSQIHIYGHSHLNMQVVKDKVKYINNAYGYPYETRITAKKLITVFEM